MFFIQRLNFLIFYIFLHKCQYSLTSKITSYSTNYLNNFMPLLFENTQTKRQKRDNSDESLENDGMQNSTFPSDVEVEDDNKSSNHTYYHKTMYINKPELMSKYYVNMTSWLKQKNVNGNSKHEHLISSYRKAASVKLSFEFPFYGHKLTNLTIATGGFCYVGDQTHSWLAATQYIAPLMANFDTVFTNSTIMYGDDGSRMIVEWSRVTLRDNRSAGLFTFQVSLFKNGDIWFVYKDIPISPKNISDDQHPCKLGISDAYLYNHKTLGTNVPQSSPQNKRIIHEYHRITINPKDVKSNTIVVLNALPTCLDFNNCGDCMHAKLDYFQCSWCSPPDASEKAFCSDQAGMNRRRQDWMEGKCAANDKLDICDILNTTTKLLTSTQPTSKNTNKFANSKKVTTLKFVTTTRQQPDDIVPMSIKNNLKNNIDESNQSNKRSENSGLAFLMLLIIMIIAFCVWLLYAFYNPHTTSGQLLIKYRPSKWQIPSSHVRYSASVHM